MRFKIVIGHVGPLKAPLTTLFSRCVESAALAAKGHTPVPEEVLALPRLVATAVDGAAYHVHAEAVLALVLIAVIVLYDWSDHAGVIAGLWVILSLIHI